MRAIGFYVYDDWGIRNCQLSDFEDLIKSGRIKIVDSKTGSPNTKPIKQSNNKIYMCCKMETNINFRTIADLRKIGFEGFKSVSDLWRDHSVIPNIKGVYMVVRATDTAPEFLAKGTGAFYKKKDPNVPVDLLRANWVNDTCVVYIGQAGGKRKGKQPQSTLRSRLDQYLRFGQGKSSAGHRGGCFIWQLKDAANLLFCWKPLPTDDPREVEKSLIQLFKNSYGNRPFANRQD